MGFTAKDACSSQHPFSKSFTAKDAKDAKEKKITAESAEAAEKKNSLSG
jgi:hypothetical protein